MDVLQFRDLIVIPTLHEIGLSSPSAVNLLMGTFSQESSRGRYLKQLGGGPAIGVYQMEPQTHDDIWISYLKYRGALANRVRQCIAHNYNDQENLLFNLKYQTAMCRVHYYRVRDPLPSADNVGLLAEYWKNHYNTEKGAGTVEEFVQNFPMEALMK